MIDLLGSGDHFAEVERRTSVGDAYYAAVLVAPLVMETTFADINLVADGKEPVIEHTRRVVAVRHSVGSSVGILPCVHGSVALADQILSSVAVVVGLVELVPDLSEILLNCAFFNLGVAGDVVVAIGKPQPVVAYGEDEVGLDAEVSLHLPDHLLDFFSLALFNLYVEGVCDFDEFAV